MRIAYITVQFPFGPKEAFLRPELVELLSQGHEVLVLALRPGNDVEQAHAAITANALPLNTWREWKAGIRSIAANRRFGPVMQETAFLATRGSLVARCKNLTVTPLRSCGGQDRADLGR